MVCLQQIEQMLFGIRKSNENVDGSDDAIVTHVPPLRKFSRKARLQKLHAYEELQKSNVQLNEISTTKSESKDDKLNQKQKQSLKLDATNKRNYNYESKK